MTTERKKVYVVGVGMTRFWRAQHGPEFPAMAKEAITNALRDAQLSYDAVNAVVAGYCYGDPTCGQRAAYEMGLTGVPVLNVNNNCSTASSALFIARQFIKAGSPYQCVLALGFEKMEKNLSQRYTDAGYTSPVGLHFDHLHAFGASPERVNNLNDMTGNVIKMFGEAAIEHQKKYGTTDKQFGYIAYKNHRQSKHNPYAQNQTEYPLDAILDKKRTLYGPITSYQACPTGDGAAAAIVCSEEFVIKHNLQHKAVEIVSQVMISDLPSTFDMHDKSYINLCGYEIVKRGAEQIFQESGLSPKDIDVLEVHDCFSCNELLVMEAVGLCKQGEGGALIENGSWITNKAGGDLYQMGNQWVINPSGGLESKGHPIGATGLAQCAELVWQLRGEAGKRQVDNARVALQHNYGLGSAAVLTLYRRYTPSTSTSTTLPTQARL